MSIYEWIFKSPINIKIMEMLQFGCALLLISFMVYVTWFDVGDLSKKVVKESRLFLLNDSSTVLHLSWV